MFNKKFEDIKFQDIENLIEQGVVEYQNLEYKREVWGGSDSNKKEMLKDVTSMANKYGGNIIIGIEEDGETGKANAVCNIPNAEQERDRVLSTLITSVQPRIPSVKIKVVGDDIKVILISIPNSFKKPHLITFQGINQFWIRHDRQKSLMSIDEIQDSIINTVNITKDITGFLDDRKEEILKEANVEPTFIIGAFPVTAEKEMIDIGDQQIRNFLKKPPNERYGGANFEFNYGNPPAPSYYGLSAGGGQDWRKMELHRNGYLEAIVKIDDFLDERRRSNTQSSHTIPEENEDYPIISNRAIVEYIYSFFKQCNQIYSYYGYDGQVYVYCSFINIKNFGLKKYRAGSIGGFNDLARWRKDNLDIKPIAFTEIDEIKIAKTLSDRIWQSFGFEGEPYLRDGAFQFGG